MKKFLFIVWCALSITTYAQIDEIKEQLKTKAKSEETVVWLCDTAFSLYNTYPIITERIAQLALQKAIEWDSDLGIARANHVLGVSHWARDNYTVAIEYYLNALKYYDLLNNQRGMAIINMNIGIIYDDLDQTERGKTYYFASEKIIRSLGDSSNLAKVLNNLAVAYRRTHKRDSAFYYYKEVMALRKAMYDSVGIARTYNNIALLFLEKGSDTEREDAVIAQDNLSSALAYLEEGTDNRLYATINANMGRTLIFLGQLVKAKVHLDVALKLAQKHDFKVIEQWVYQYSVELYKRRNDYKTALEYSSKEVAIDKELRNAEINEQIEELNIKYETAKRERLLAELEKQKAIDEGIKNMLIIGVAAVILIAILLIFYSYQKRKKDKVISQLQFQKMSDEINVKNKEIASYTMSFLQKNQLMEELKAQINELKKNSDISTNKELTRINRIVDNTFRSDEEWKTFQITFDQMHDGFFQDLKRAYPDISNAELKLCALLRLNMNLKESAKILGIAADSVKTARYRLRKKLGLKTEDNLIDFLIQFEKPQPNLYDKIQK
ncbi:transcriptional regulator [Ekhidna sp.]|uniref:tetratricopeptide repeat protein n=1 Tax=Ekhidna sp. TaxID=2608089 RepID=UPI003298A9A8